MAVTQIEIGATSPLIFDATKEGANGGGLIAHLGRFGRSAALREGNSPSVNKLFLGDHRSALEYFHRAIRTSPTDPRLYFAQCEVASAFH